MYIKQILMPSIILVLISILGCATQQSHKPQDKDIATQANAVEVTEEGAAELIVFNISGWTLIPGNQHVTDNGKVFISLPRKTYKKVSISSGTHDLGMKYREGSMIKLNVVAGERYYVVVGYKPERSWVFPITGDPLVMKQITEQEAKPFIKEFIPQGPVQRQ